MTFETRRGLSLRIGGALTYLASYSPDEFPAEDQMTLEKGMSSLLGNLRELEALSGASEAKTRLQGFISEVETAWDLFKSGKGEEGCAKLERLSDDFRDFEQGKKVKVSFIAGPDGVKKV